MIYAILLLIFLVDLALLTHHICILCRSFDDNLDPRHSWRHALSSRQGTLSDDLEEDPDVCNASMESLYSSSDRDSEIEAMAATYCADATVTRRSWFLHQREQQRELRRPLLRQALLGSSTASSSGRRVSVGSRGGSSGHPGYGSCSGNDSMMTMASGLSHMQEAQCSASTGDLDKLNIGIDDPGFQLPPRLLARRKSVSLLNLTPPGRASYYVPDVPPSTPPPGPGELFLDDTLLDGNMADILFSVEALWPKK